MPKVFDAPPGFVLNPDYLVPELRAQRDALLEALKLIVEFVDAPTEGKRPDVFVMRISKARAVVEQAEFGESHD